MKRVIKADVQDSLSQITDIIDQFMSLNDMIGELDQPGLDYLEALCPGFTGDGMSFIQNLIKK